jgi:hypothetical protein
MINIVRSVCQIVVVVTLFATIIPLFLGAHYREQVGDSFFPWIIVPLLISGGLWFLMIKINTPETWDLGEVNDLVQGSIEAPIGEIEAAFRHFSEMPTIEIVNITENLHDL